MKLPTAGVKKVLVFASANGGRYHRIGKTSKRKLHFHGKPGRRYRFYSIAVDNAGNREAPPAGPDAKLKGLAGQVRAGGQVRLGAGLDRLGGREQIGERLARCPVASISMSSIAS